MTTTTRNLVLASLMTLTGASVSLGATDSGRADAASVRTASGQVRVVTEAEPMGFSTADSTAIDSTKIHDWSTDRQNDDLPTAGEQINLINAYFGIDPDTDSETEDDRPAAPELFEPVHDPMDLDQNGVVNFQDFVQLFRWFGTDQGDLDQNGQTDGIDLGLMLERLANQKY
jgi:hypothetical protein